MNKEAHAETVTERAHPGRLCFYHPTGNGSGSAARFELRLNRAGESGYNCVFLEIARQSASASREAGARQAARFDWQHKITAKLGFGDLCDFVAVLEGAKKAVGGERGGIFHATRDSNTIIALQKRNDQPGFLLGLSRKNGSAASAEKAHIVLNELEALGLKHVLIQTLFKVAFHGSVPGTEKQSQGAAAP